jgi:hypothetical protein
LAPARVARAQEKDLYSIRIQTHGVFAVSEFIDSPCSAGHVEGLLGKYEKAVKKDPTQRAMKMLE